MWYLVLISHDKKGGDWAQGLGQLWWGHPHTLTPLTLLSSPSTHLGLQPACLCAPQLLPWAPCVCFPATWLIGAAAGDAAWGVPLLPARSTETKSSRRGQSRARWAVFTPLPITSLRCCMLVICSLYHFPPGGSKKSAKLPRQSYEYPAQFIQAQQEGRGLIGGGMLWIPASSFFPWHSWWRGQCHMKAALSPSIIVTCAAAFQGTNWPHLVALALLPPARLYAGGIQIQAHLGGPVFKLFLGITKLSRTKLGWMHFWTLDHSIVDTRDGRVY